MTDILAIAASLVAAGISVIPVSMDGTKRPAFASLPKDADGNATWAPFKSRLATDPELVAWFAKPKGIGIVAGKVSGSLEILDIESESAAADWARHVIATPIGEELLHRLPRVVTPSGGWHIYYRCSEIEGNQKLARTLLPDNKIQTVIETRGEGGYVIAPGSPPKCHELAKPYVLVDENCPITKVPRITPDERDLLLTAARALDTVPDDSPQLPRPRDQRVVQYEGASVIDTYNATAHWVDILQPAGWKFLKSNRSTGTEYWQCPHSDDHGNCATIRTYTGGRELLYIFCTSAHGFQPEKGHNKFQAYAVINHNGNQSLAARHLRKEWGWKGKKPPVDLKPLTDVVIEDRSQMLRSLGKLFNTDAANAKRLAFYNSERFLYSPEQGWLVWRDNHWVLDEAHEVWEAIVQLGDRILEEMAMAETLLDPGTGDDVINVRKELFKLARHVQALGGSKGCEFHARHEMLANLSEFDTKHHELTCINGILDLESGKLREATPEDLIMRMANVEYDPNAECPRFKQFLQEIFAGDQDLIDYMQRALGYSLSGNVSEQALFFCYGHGQNGKSTLLDTYLHMLGTYAKVTRPSTLIDKGNNAPSVTNDIARLAGVRFTRTNELSENARLDEDLVKQFTSGEAARVTARFLNKEFFEFTPRFKLWFDSNHKPVIKGSDWGIWRRLHLIPFAVEIKEKDLTLPQKLRDELPGILTWCVNGYQWWRTEGLKPPSSVVAATQAFRAESDLIGAFLADCTDRTAGEPPTMVPSMWLYNCYKDWCLANGTPAQSMTRFGRYLTERAKLTKGIAGSQPYRDLTVYHKIQLKERYHTKYAQNLNNG